MMEILEFVFRSGWHFAGSLVLLLAACHGVAEVVSAWRARP